MWGRERGQSCRVPRSSSHHSTGPPSDGGACQDMHDFPIASEGWAAMCDPQPTLLDARPKPKRVDGAGCDGCAGASASPEVLSSVAPWVSRVTIADLACRITQAGGEDAAAVSAWNGYAVRGTVSLLPRRGAMWLPLLVSLSLAPAQLPSPAAETPPDAPPPRPPPAAPDRWFLMREFQGTWPGWLL